MSDTHSNHNSDEEGDEEFDPTIPKESNDDDVASETLSDPEQEAQDGNQDALKDLLDGEENVVYDDEELEAERHGEDLYNGDFEQYVPPLKLAYR